MKESTHIRPTAISASPPHDDDSVEPTLVEEVIDVLKNDECPLYDVHIVQPPDMHHIHLQDVLLQDRLNEDIDLQDAIPKTAHIQDYNIATVRQLQDRELHIKMHIDGGSNRSVTPALELLEGIMDIPPYHMHGTNSTDIALTCTKVGTLKLRCNNDAILRIKTYYSPQANETIITPGDITNSNDNPYHIWTKVSNMKSKNGHITFHAEDGIFETRLDTTLRNGLWYTQHQLLDILSGIHPDEPIVRKLSKNAQHEL